MSGRGRLGSSWWEVLKRRKRGRAKWGWPLEDVSKDYNEIDLLIDKSNVNSN